MKSIRLKIANVGLARWELKKISENKLDTVLDRMA